MGTFPNAAGLAGKRWFAVLAVLLCLGTAGFLEYRTEVARASASHGAVREAFFEDLAVRAGQIERNVQSPALLLRQLEDLVVTKPELSVEDFDRVGVQITGRPLPLGVRRIQLLREGRVSHVYPLEGNQEELGRVPPEVPEWAQRTTVLWDPQNLRLLGPFECKGRSPEVLILRRVRIPARPVRGASSGEGDHRAGPSTWGAACIVLDLEAVLAGAGVSQVDHAFARVGGTTLWGNDALDPARTGSYPVRWFGQEFELRGVPWQAELPVTWLWQLRVSAGLAALFLSSLVWFALRRPVQLQSAVRKATTDLAASEGRLRSLLQSTPVGIVYVDAEGRTAFVNPRWEELTGLQLAESKGGVWLSRVHPDDERETTRAWNEFVLGRAEFSHEYRFVHSDGSAVWVAGSATTILDSAGDAVGYTVVGLEITARKRAQAEREEFEGRALHVQKLESLGVLAGGIAHDFNNLLVGLMAHADLALDAVPKDSSVRFDLDRILSITNRAAELCNQMLSYAGRDSAEMETINLTELLEEIPQLLGVSTSKNAVITYELDRDLPAVEADAGQMRQVLMNLVINASEATKYVGGNIAITTSSIHLTAPRPACAWFGEEMRPGRYVFVEITDDGCGMSEATLDRMFEPFFTTKFSGRGLGMSAVLGIVRNHGGFLEVTSVVGSGSTFGVFLPASANILVAKTETPRPESDWKGMGTVLLVDDEESVREASGLLLQRLGFDVLTAREGREALELYKRNAHSIRLVLLDLTMPGMGGEECLERLMGITRDVCVVMSSGFGERDVVDRLFETGARDFIRKPYDLNRLREMLERNLGETQPIADVTTRKTAAPENRPS